jgi:molecular chaperone GrpE
MDSKEIKKKSKKVEIEELEEKITILNEEVLRAKADLINYRKRKDEEVSEMLKYANEDIIKNLLIINDNFERALKVKVSSEEEQKYLDGFNMIYEKINNIMQNNDIKEIDCLGKQFDSKYASCLFTEEDKTKEDNEVLEVLVKGYSYKDRVLKFASVKVNKLDKEIKKEEKEENE